MINSYASVHFLCSATQTWRLCKAPLHSLMYGYFSLGVTVESLWHHISIMSDVSPLQDI